MTLSVKQKKVVDELFEGITEDELFSKALMTRSLFLTWLSQKDFIDALQSRVAVAAVRSQMMIARQSPLAVERLVALTKNENPETARKACLDILELSAKCSGEPSGLARPTDPQKGQPRMTTEQASRILAALAEKDVQGSASQ